MQTWQTVTPEKQQKELALLRPSPELAVLLGSRTALTRDDAFSGLWAYAKARNLNEGRSMRCDAAMHRAFGVQSLWFREVDDALSSHLTFTGSSQKEAMRHSANKSEGVQSNNAAVAASTADKKRRDVARTKAFCDEHGLGHLWPQFEKLGINTPADIAALSQLDIVRGLGQALDMRDIARVKVKFNLEQGKVHRNQSAYRHLGSFAIGMVSMNGFIDGYNTFCIFLGPATWLAWPHLLNRVRIVPLHRTE
jgi:hypothetical protein